MRFIYLSPANRVHSLYLSECADSLIYWHWKVLGLKADLHPTVSLRRGSTQVIERSNERERRTAESERRATRTGGGGGREADGETSARSTSERLET